MAMKSLLVCRDPDALRVLRRVLEDANLPVEVCTGADPAVEHLAKAKFDAILVDCDDMAGAKEVLKMVRKAPSNKSAIVFAIINGVTTVREAFDMGANFVLDKPLSMERVGRSMKAAQGLILRERRRYFRQEIKLRAAVMLPGGEEVQAWVSNLSEGGISVKLPKAGPQSGAVRVRFSLPGGKQVIDAKGEIAWTVPDSEQMGVRFLTVEKAAQKELEQWLSKNLESAQPIPLFINASRGVGRLGK